MQNDFSSVSNDTVFCMGNACPLQIDMHSLTIHGKLLDFRIFVENSCCSVIDSRIDSISAENSILAASL